MSRQKHINRRRVRRRAFSLPELLVVIGILSLLVAILLPALQLAQRQARSTRCAAQQHDIGLAMESVLDEYHYYPLWDDNGAPERYIWSDVLVQRRQLGNARVTLCPEDPRPGPVNVAHASESAAKVYDFAERPRQPGLDCSYGISVPLAAGAWHSHGASAYPEDPRPRRLENYDRYPSQRLLAADGNWSTIYNLSGEALRGHAWNYLYPWDNGVAYRHPGFTANILYQDNHVERLQYKLQDDPPVNTALAFVWYPGEPIHVGPPDSYNGNWYPHVPAVDLTTGAGDGAYPRELAPGYYTYYNLWTVLLDR